MIIRLRFDPRNLFIGVWWKDEETAWRAYICPIPTVTIMLAWWKRRVRRALKAAK